MKELNYSDIDSMMELHTKWLKHEAGGKRLILSKCDVSNMDLSGRDFRMCVAIGTDFRGCNLKGSRFNGAVLDDSDMSYADVSGADFTGASLNGVKKSGLDTGLGKSADIRTIDDLIRQDEIIDEAPRPKVELDEDDMKAVDGVAVDKMLADMEYEELPDDDNEYND